MSSAGSSVVKKIWRLLTSVERRQALALLSLMILGMLLETLGVGLVTPSIALLTQQNIAQNYPLLQPLLDALGNPTQKSLIIGGMLALVAVYLLKTTFLAYLAWRQNKFAFGVQSHLSQRLYQIYLRQPYAFHLQRNSAQLIRNVITEVNLFTFSIMLPAMVLVTEALVLIGLCCLLLAFEPFGSAIVLGTLGLAAWAFYRFTRGRLKRWGKERQYHDGLRLQHLQQGLGGVKDVKLLGREVDFLEQFRIHNQHGASVGQKQLTLQQLPRLWLELLAVSGLAILILSMLAQNRPLEAILPILGLFAATAFRIIPSVNRVLGALNSLRYGLAVIDVLDNELKLPALSVGAGATLPLPFEQELNIRHVSFVYDASSIPTIEDVSLSIRQGESVGFIGSSGAGKSTLVDVLLGLLSPGSGEILVDGANIQDNLRGWQNQIGYVSQSIFLTDDSLRRNVALGLGNHEIDDVAINRAIQAAQLTDFVDSLPDGLDTLVGERGARLSGGQRQRIGIARALYHDPAVLVLDEATSALDLETEREVMQAVNALHGKKTILIVAHRLSTVENCDRLYRIEHGKITKEGSPEDLLKTNRTTASPV